MKLKDEYVLEKDGEQYLLISKKREEILFINSNNTTNFVLKMLSDSDGFIEQADIVERMLEYYDADRKLIERDLEELIKKMRKAGIIED